MITYRWSLSAVNPDNVCRALWRVAAVNWDDDPTRISFRLNSTVVELFDGPFPALLISGSTRAAVRAAAGRLDYHDIDEAIIEIGDTGIVIGTRLVRDDSPLLGTSMTTASSVPAMRAGS